MTVHAISSETSIPRTSLYYMLPKLVDRGFVEQIRRNGKIYWKKISSSDIYDTYSKILAEPNGTQSFTKKISKNTEIMLNIGNKNVLDVFTQISDMPGRSRFYGIQPEQSLIQAVTTNPLEDILKFNHKIKDKKIIVEGIIHEKGTDSMVKTLSKEDRLKFLKSFSERSADIAKMPDNFLDKTKAEIYLYQEKVAIINWSEQFGVIIKNKDVFELIKEMFESTKYLLNRYDQNEKIARKLIDYSK